MLTYVIPTHNRSKFLRRALQYYSQLKCSAPILIADSSDLTNAAENRRTVATCADQLNVQYRHLDLGVISKCRVVLETVDTPFSVFAADDDFQVPSALNKCTEFLQKYPEYTTCGGALLLATADSSADTSVWTYRSVESSEALRRLNRVSLDRNAHLFYAVHRTKDLTERFQQTDEFTDYDSARIMPEVLLTQLMALRGRIKLLNDVSYIYTKHGENEHLRVPNFQNVDAFDSIFDLYKVPLSERLRELTGLSHKQTLKIVKQSLIDLVPECFGLFSGGPPRHPGQLWRRLRSLRKFREFGLIPDKRKRKLAIGEARAMDPAITLALQLCCGKGATASCPAA